MAKADHDQLKHPRPAQVISLADFDEHSADAWTHACRAAARMLLLGAEMDCGVHLVPCTSCSEVVWVGYELAEEEYSKHPGNSSHTFLRPGRRRLCSLLRARAAKHLARLVELVQPTTTPSSMKRRNTDLRRPAASPHVGLCGHEVFAADEGNRAVLAREAVKELDPCI
ncbi:hypothetical protein B0H14DRAFT_3897870 [Mycena olivaceomarginata]|nr:hypothetical protein B0H14DRAFT_3897870 [Mycena olivaceomarginata]